MSRLILRKEGGDICCPMCRQFCGAEWVNDLGDPPVGEYVLPCPHECGANLYVTVKASYDVDARVQLPQGSYVRWAKTEDGKGSRAEVLVPGKILPFVGGVCVPVAHGDKDKGEDWLWRSEVPPQYGGMKDDYTYSEKAAKLQIVRHLLPYLRYLVAS